MTNYIGNAKEQNHKYDLAIEEIKKMRKIYQDSIDELDSNIEGVSSVNQLKKSIQLKIDELDKKIKDINSTKITITKKANSLQRAEDERKRQEKLKQEQEK